MLSPSTSSSSKVILLNTAVYKRLSWPRLATCGKQTDQIHKGKHVKSPTIRVVTVSSEHSWLSVWAVSMCTASAGLSTMPWDRLQRQGSLSFKGQVKRNATEFFLSVYWYNKNNDEVNHFWGGGTVFLIFKAQPISELSKLSKQGLMRFTLRNKVKLSQESTNEQPSFTPIYIVSRFEDLWLQN